MKKVVLLISIFLFAFNVNAASTTNVTLKSCIDGDTANFVVDGKEVKARFLAINTPEYENEDFGKDAGEYTCKLLKEAKTITIEYDSKATTDKYDRALVWVWVDKNLLQERLVSEGYAEVAYVYDKYKYADSLCVLQQDAIKNKKNIWSNTKREQDYCGGVDTSKVINIIDYELLTVTENQDDYSQEDINKILEQIQSTQSKAEAINNATVKVNEFLDENKEGISNVLLYVVLGIAGIYLLLKTIKDMKQ